MRLRRYFRLFIDYRQPMLIFSDGLFYCRHDDFAAIIDYFSAAADVAQCLTPLF